MLPNTSITRKYSLLKIIVLMRWMKLEPIIQSEVSQKEKHQYSILTHIAVNSVVMAPRHSIIDWANLLFSVSG